ncbi:hypothetical protein ACFHW2_25640 [Actinomadura sp. LOL_016]|uniref:hypothetical protein n=1 Tax=unclassified Actinomadura TaxID=2626254 RepID=UPI003A806E61
MPWAMARLLTPRDAEPVLVAGLAGFGACPITGPLRTYGSVIAVCRNPAVAASPVRAWTVSTTAVATPSAETRSSVAADRWTAITVAVCPGRATSGNPDLDCECDGDDSARAPGRQ